MFGELREIARRHVASIVTSAVRDRDELEVDDLRKIGVDVSVVWRARSDRTLRESFSRLFAWVTTGMPLGVLDPETGEIAHQISAHENIDIVHVAASRWASPGLFRAPRHGAQAFVLSDHESAPGFGAHQARSPQGPGDRLLELVDAGRWRRFLAGAYATFDLIQVFTAEDASSIAAAYPEAAERIRVNPFGVDLPLVNVDAPPNDESLLFVGNFRHPPNVDAANWLAEEIFPQILAKRPKANLTLAGAGAHSALLPRAGITIVSDAPDLGPIYDRSSVVVAPLRTGGGMRLKVMEGMAHGKPVVCTSIAAAGVSSDAAPAPLIVADDARTFARAVSALLAAPAARLQLGQAARRHVALHFSWNSYGQRLDTFYAAAIQSSIRYRRPTRSGPRGPRSPS